MAVDETHSPTLTAPEAEAVPELEAVPVPVPEAVPGPEVEPVPEAVPGPGAEPARRRGGRVAGAALTGLAALFVLLALLAPADLDRFGVAAFLRIPVEGLLGVLLVLVLPPRARRPVALAGGALLGLLLVVKVADIGTDLVLYRPFDLVLDWPLLTPAVDYVDVTAGRGAAVAAVVGAVLLVGAVVVLMARAVLRLSRRAEARRPVVTRALVAVTAAWVTCAAPGAEFAPGLPVASHDAVSFVGRHAHAVRVGLRDREAFAAEASTDAFRDVPADELLTSLRGKDVVVAFVESYGRSAVEHPALAPVVGAALDDGARRLAAAGYASRSAYLTSPTAGGGSWLAQATLLSGLRIDNQQRYRTLVASDRLTLNGAFRRAGWRSVGVVPGITRAWPEGDFFRHDRVYAAADLGYRGPRFGYATMPDQYALSAFQERERRPGHAPVVGVVPLLSSHAPWTPVPTRLPWDEVGDGAVFGGAAGEEAPDSIFGRDPDAVRADYARSVAYSVDVLVSYLETYGGDDTVLVFLGDHQPAQVVTGDGASKDVPVTVVTRDAALMARTDAWGWTDGLEPAPDAPVRPMEAFRDQFLTAFR
ncbi:sulfatase [Saccharothrix sp. Mg75]|uniref:sulfatase n=1 Tax=Saccharothrix sp. Mg75 TaxID=3445357 RepID=UPI003EEFE4D9